MRINLSADYLDSRVFVTLKILQMIDYGTFNRLRFCGRVPENIATNFKIL